MYSHGRRLHSALYPVSSSFQIPGQGHLSTLTSSLNKASPPSLPPPSQRYLPNPAPTSLLLQDPARPDVFYNYILANNREALLVRDRCELCFGCGYGCGCGCGCGVVWVWVWVDGCVGVLGLGVGV